MNISSKSGSTNYRYKVFAKEKRMGMLGTGSYLLFVIFQLLHHHCMAVAGDILVAPETQRVAINSGMAEFYCKAMGHNARWLVNGNTYDPENRTEDGLQFTEVITPDPDGFDDNVYDIYIQIPSSLNRNCTEIRCLSVRDQPVVSDLAKLIIMGGPAAPEPFLDTISTSLLTLEWNKPFTWPEYPIEHYTLTSNHSLYYPSEKRINNATMSQGSMQIEKMDGVEECEVIEFTLKANNGLADSPAGTVTGGYPIALDGTVASITEQITFSGDLRPIISLDIQLPRVCWFQEIEYSVRLTRTDDNGVMVAETEPQTVNYWEQQSVTISFQDNLSSGATYTATASFLSVTGSDTSEMEITTTLHTTMSTNSPATQPLQPTTTSPLTEEMLIIIGIVGGVLVLILVMFVFIAAMACVNIRRRTRISSTRCSTNIQNRPLPMVTNPIYEGSPVYETVDQHLKSLSMERPQTPTTPTSTDHLLIESPYAITTIDPGYTTQIPQQFIEPENYTIMISAGHKSVSRSESDDVRYVQEPGSMNIADTEW